MMQVLSMRFLGRFSKALSFSSWQPKGKRKARNWSYCLSKRNSTLSYSRHSRQVHRQQLPVTQMSKPLQCKLVNTSRKILSLNAQASIECQWQSATRHPIWPVLKSASKVNITRTQRMSHPDLATVAYLSLKAFLTVLLESLPSHIRGPKRKARRELPSALVKDWLDWLLSQLLALLDLLDVPYRELPTLQDQSSVQWQRKKVMKTASAMKKKRKGTKFLTKLNMMTTLPLRALLKLWMMKTTLMTCLWEQSKLLHRQTLSSTTEKSQKWMRNCSV